MQHFLPSFLLLGSLLYLHFAKLESGELLRKTGNVISPGQFLSVCCNLSCGLTRQSLEMLEL